MQEQKTQQFAKFYLKDVKLKIDKELIKKNSIDSANLSSDS
tara:strand:- start:252 stop:374 length:123 start_codon:yes stop_codon:yes gene_type:complete